MTKKLRLEFIPISIFFLSAIGVAFHLPYAIWIMLLSGLIPAFLYFYGAFWLFAETGMLLIVRIFIGLVYSVNMLACIFCLLRWPFGNLFSIISYVGLEAIVILCLFNLKKPGYRGQLYRCVAFVVILSAVYFYRRSIA